MYKMLAKQKPDGVVAGSTKRHGSRFYQLKTGHCLTGQYLNWTKSRPTPQCWWCASGTQTRDHLFKECVEWRDQQRTLWAEVRKETGRWKSRWKVRDLLVDERGAEDEELGAEVFFCLFILACDLCRSWRRTLCPVFLSARCQG